MPTTLDLVDRSKLETSFFTTYTQHTFPEDADNHHIPVHERWTRKRRLGQGGNGTVWLEACDRPAKQCSKFRAVKEIPINPSDRKKAGYYRELEAVLEFSQDRYIPSFVRSFGWFESPESIFIAMEYMPYGDLQNHLSSPIREEEVKTITQQLARGLRHINDNGFTHRDLKPGNILVQSTGPDWLVKISDFGISKKLRPEQQTAGTLHMGTLGFMAPEMLDFVQDHSHPCAADIWSLGTVVFTMLTRKLFLKTMALTQKYVTGSLDFPISDLNDHGATPLALCFLKILLRPLPEERAQIAEVTRHEWLQTSAQKAVAYCQYNSEPDIISNPRSTLQRNDSESFGSDTDNAPSAAWSTPVQSQHIRHELSSTSSSRDASVLQNSSGCDADQITIGQIKSVTPKLQLSASLNETRSGESSKTPTPTIAIVTEAIEHANSVLASYGPRALDTASLNESRSPTGLSTSLQYNSQSPRVLFANEFGHTRRNSQDKKGQASASPSVWSLSNHSGVDEHDSDFASVTMRLPSIDQSVWIRSYLAFNPGPFAVPFPLPTTKRGPPPSRHLTVSQLERHGPRKTLIWTEPLPHYGPSSEAAYRARSRSLTPAEDSFQLVRAPTQSSFEQQGLSSAYQVRLAHRSTGTLFQNRTG